MFKGIFKSVPSKFFGKFKGVLRKGIQVRFKGISSSFMGVLRVFARSSKGVSGKIQWCFKGVSRKFQKGFKKD